MPLILRNFANERRDVISHVRLFEQQVRSTNSVGRVVASVKHRRRELKSIVIIHMCSQHPTSSTGRTNQSQLLNLMCESILVPEINSNLGNNMFL